MFTMFITCNREHIFNISKSTNSTQVSSTITQQLSSRETLRYRKHSNANKISSDRQAICEWRNNEARSCNHCCSGKAMNITQPVCVCDLSYPAYNAHPPYCHLWPAPLYSIFPRYLTHDMIFEKKLLNTKCSFSLQLLFETLLILRINEQNIIANVYWSSIFIFVRF